MLTGGTIWLLAPEIALLAAAVAIYLAGAFRPAQNGEASASRLWTWLAAGGVLVAALALWQTSGRTAQGGGVSLDGLSSYARWLTLACGGLLVLLASRTASGRDGPEYAGSLLAVLAGAMLVSAADNLVLLFVALELISIPTYILLYLGRRGAASQEAAAKYFYLSVLASAVLLYGFSFLYGAAGSLDLDSIRDRLAGAAETPGALGPLAKIAGVLVFAGLGFKIAAVPFHFYAPDVYQGTTSANAALLSVVPKIAGFVALLRVVALAIPPEDLYAFTWRVALALAVLTMTFGNVMALWQDHLRRLLAYSSVAQAGYVLVALAVGLASAGLAGPGGGAGERSAWSGLGAVLLYLAVYAAATIGAFAVLAWLGRGEREVEGVEELAGLARTRPHAAALLALFMFSLAGIPPLAGFWGKWAVFAGALRVGLTPDAGPELRVWFIGLAVIGMVNAAVAAGYYLRVVAVMYFRLPLGAPRPTGDRGPLAAALLCGALTVAIGLWPGPLVRESDRAAEGLRESVIEFRETSRSLGER